MTTPNPVSQHRRAEPVPQWCYDAAEEIIGHRATYIAAIIARHAPQAEPPQPAPRYACSKLAAVGDTVKVLGSEPPLIMKVEELSTTGGLYIKSLTGTACMLLNSSQVEFVPEVTPAHPVCRGCNQPLKAENAWMSDGCPCNNPRGINHGLVPTHICTCDKCDQQQTGGTRKPAGDEKEEQYIPAGYHIVEDPDYGERLVKNAEGNALPALPATGAAIGVERFIVNNNSVSTPGNGSYGSKKYLGAGTTLVLAADHDRLLAERDGEIVELKQKLADEERRGDLHADLNKRVAEAVGNPFSGPGSSWHDLPEKVAALRTRAEAAEAKCDAIRVQWQSLHDEREEQHAALRRRGIRFVKVGGVLEAIGADRELDMLKTPQSQADIDEAEEIAEGCVVNMENFDDVSSSEMHLVCTRLLNLREQQRRLQRHIRDKEAVIDELSGRCEKLAAEHAAALGLVADIRNALGDNGKRMQPELLVHCTQLAAANERVAEFEARLDAVRKMISAGQ